MRHNYVGDIGDYMKYSLLRQLAGNTGTGHKRRLGIVWYLYEDPCKPTDGNHIKYLEPAQREKHRPTDPELYDKLQQLITEGDRHISAIRRRGILPADTVYYEEPLSLSHLPKGNKEAMAMRLNHRTQWLEGALKATKDCDIIFVDPDNGLEVKSTPRHHDRGPKSTYYDELKPFWQRGQSLVIYQHKNMHESAEQQVKNRQAEMQEHFGQIPEAHYYPASGGRIFFVLSQ